MNHCHLIFSALRFSRPLWYTSAMNEVGYAIFADFAPKLVAKPPLSDRKMKVGSIVCTHVSTNPENLVTIGTAYNFNKY